MKVHIINNFYSLNRGWAALVLSVTKFLAERIHGIEFTIESLYPDIDTKSYLNVKCVKSITSSKSVFIESVIRAFLWRALSRALNVNSMLNTEFLMHYRDADVILDLSGDGLCPANSRSLWYRFRRMISVVMNLSSVIIGLLLRKPVILYSASVGNLGVLTPFAKLVLKGVSMIAVRDKESLNYLIKIGVKGPRLLLVGDPAFLLKSSSNMPCSRSPIVGLSISYEAAKHFYNYDLDGFARLMARVIDHIVETYSANVILVPFSVGGYWEHEDDRVICLKVRGYSERKGMVSIVKGYCSLGELTEVIANCDLFVAARMHASIIALSSYVPTIVIAHSRKFYDLMSTLGINNMICDAYNLSYDALVRKIDNAWQNKSLLRHTLRSRVEALRSRAINGLDLLTVSLVKFCHLSDDKTLERAL